MSTYLYLECRDHTPYLTSWGEVGQHLRDLPRIRQEIADRALFIAAGDRCPDYGNHFTNHAAGFFYQHPHCVIGIRDEYGAEHPITGEKPHSPGRPCCDDCHQDLTDARVRGECL